MPLALDKNVPSRTTHDVMKAVDSVVVLFHVFKL